jgi:hypothetical protein
MNPRAEDQILVALTRIETLLSRLESVLNTVHSAIAVQTAQHEQLIGTARDVHRLTLETQAAALNATIHSTSE